MASTYFAELRVVADSEQEALEKVEGLFADYDGMELRWIGEE